MYIEITILLPFQDIIMTIIGIVSLQPQKTFQILLGTALFAFYIFLEGLLSFLESACHITIQFSVSVRGPSNTAKKIVSFVWERDHWQ